jgi:farnesyl diphosphate synthase
LIREQGSFQNWCLDHAERCERALERVLPSADQPPPELHKAMRYAVLNGGKRIRPLLVYAAAELSQAPAPLADCAACAVELIHAYSLVHDDLPCMDNDVIRRGKPTVHVVFGEANAMLVGDALQALAFEVLTQPLQAHAGLEQGARATAVADNAVVGHHQAAARAEAVMQMCQQLAQAAGSLGMAGGQAIDLDAVGKIMTRDQLQLMHERKTGAMLRAAVLLGGMAGRSLSSSERESLNRYGLAIGLAFQVVDDILDVQADSTTLGKTAGKDALNDKPTYVSVLGLEQSREFARQLCCEAHEALRPFADTAHRLHELADLIVLRKS